MKKNKENNYVMFENYRIYRNGQIESKNHSLKPMRRGNGQSYVMLTINGIQKRCNRAVLVYNAFSATPFNNDNQSMQYKNGNYDDCSFENLVALPKAKKCSHTAAARLRAQNKKVLLEQLQETEYVMFGDYKIYRTGDIVSKHGNIIKSQYRRPPIPYVSLCINGKYNWFPKSRLIYNAFSPEPVGRSKFIVPINGNYDDCSFGNLRAVTRNEYRMINIDSSVEEDDYVFYDCYRIYKNGNVVSPHGHIIAPYSLTHPKSHVKLQINGKSQPRCRAHLVYNAFSPEPADFNKNVVRFRNGDYDDCSYGNLQLVPKKEYMAHNTGRSIFTQEERAQIIEEYREMVISGNPSMNKLARKYNCSMSTIIKIIHSA